MSTATAGRSSWRPGGVSRHRSGVRGGMGASGRHEPSALAPSRTGSFSVHDGARLQRNAIKNAKDYCANWVYARGPVANASHRRVPYGLLRSLAQSLASRFAREPTSTKASKAHCWRRYAACCRSGERLEGRQAHQAELGSPDVDLLSTLSLVPTTQDTRLRFAYGPTLMYDASTCLVGNFDLATIAMDQKASEPVQLMTGHPEWRTRLVDERFFRQRSSRQPLGRCAGEAERD